MHKVEAPLPSGLGTAGAALAAIILLATPASGAPAAKAGSTGRLRDSIFGTWIGLTGRDSPRWAMTPYRPTPEFTVWGKAESDRVGSGDTPGECDPWNPVSFMGGAVAFPLQILGGGNQIVMAQEAVMQPRRIYIDGRNHPPDLDPTWLGHSIGRWEGDTLVVDSVGFNGRERPLNGYVAGSVNSRPTAEPRLPTSDHLHLVERIRLVAPDILEDDFTIDDPKTFLTPFSFTQYFQRRSDLDVQEYACVGNTRTADEGQRRP